MNSPNTNNDSRKRWNVVTNVISSQRESVWGIPTDAVPRLIELMKEKEIGRFNNGENTISFINLKKLVAYLYEHDFDPDDLSKATEAFIATAHNEDLKLNVTTEERYRSIQAFLSGRFNRLVPFRLATDGVWGPASQRAWATVQHFFNIREELSPEQILLLLERIVTRHPTFIGKDTNAISFLDHTNFAEASPKGSEFEFSLSGTTGSVSKKGKEIVQFPTLSDSNPAVFDSFAECLTLLQMHNKKKPEDFCDLMLMKDHDRWQTIFEFSSRSKTAFYYSPAFALQFEDRNNVSFILRYIPKTNFAIEVIAFYISARFSIMATMGEKIEEEEIGKEYRFDAGLFFSDEGNTPGKNDPVVHTKADYIQFFIVRKNREKYVEKISEQPPGYNLPLEFYQLITSDEEDILATACFGLHFAEPGIPVKTLKRK